MKRLLWDIKLAWRWLMHTRQERSRQGGRFFSVSFGVAVVGMSFGVMALLLALGITEGFSRQYEKAVLGSQPHIMINSEDDVSEVNKLTTLVGDEVKKAALQATSIQPVLYREGMLIGGKSLKGIVLKGVSLENYFKVSGLKIILNQEKNEQHLPEIYLGKAAADESGLKPGVIKLLFPKNQHLKEITSKDLKSFFLAGVFESGVYEVDSSFALLDLKTAQDFFAVKSVSGLEVWLSDFKQASAIS